MPDTHVGVKDPECTAVQVSCGKTMKFDENYRKAVFLRVYPNITVNNIRWKAWFPEKDRKGRWGNVGFESRLDGPAIIYEDGHSAWQKDPLFNAEGDDDLIELMLMGWTTEGE